MKKIIATTLLLAVPFVACGATVDQRLNTIESNMNSLDQTLMDVNNDSVIRDLNLQKQINDLKQQGYDDTEIRNALAEHGQKQTEMVDKLIEHEANVSTIQSDLKTQEQTIKGLNENINNVRTDLQDFKHETRKGISQAIAIAGIEYPTYDDEHKFKIAFATGTYKGQTSLAYGVAYTPNYDTIISIKGTDEATSVSVGFNL